MDHLRRSRNNNTTSLSSDAEEEQTMDIPDPSLHPDELAEKKELQRIVRDAVNKLPEKKRQMIILAEFSDLSYADIATELNISEGTVKSRLSRARASLAEILSENGTFSAFIASKGRKGGKQDE